MPITKKRAVLPTRQADQVQARASSGELEKYYFRGTPESIDEENRTVDVTFTTGYRGLRAGWFGDYYEELEVSKKAMNVGRLKQNGAVLFGHDSHSLDNLVGAVEKVTIDEEAGSASARVRFDTDPSSDRVFQKVKNKILRSVSVGYMVYRYEELLETENELPIFRATDWEPVEISFVSVPFDPHAMVRSEKNIQERAKCFIVTREGEEMKTKKTVTKVREEEIQASDETEVQETPEVAEEPAAVAAPEVKEEPAAAEVAEVKEEPAAEGSAAISSILRSCEKAGFGIVESRKIVEDFNNKTITLVQAHERIVEEWTKKDRKVASSMEIEAGSYDKMTVMADGIRNAISHRIHPSKNALDEKGRLYRGLSLVEIGRNYLRAVGINPEGLSRDQVARKLLSQDTRFKVRGGLQGTTDFPELVANVANKTLQDAYALAPQTFRPWTRQSTNPDFKEMSRVAVGSGSSFEKVTEHGNYKYGTLSETAEKYSLASYGKIFAFTRQMIVNDDLNALQRFMTSMGAKAAMLESDIVYAILTANAAMADGTALFHANHGNLGTTGAIGLDTLSEMRELGRTQTDLDGALLNMIFRHLIVPAAKETEAQQAVTSVLAAQIDKVNVFQGAYQVHVEPRLDANSDTAWYAACDPGLVDTIEYCYLEGNESVRVEEEVEFDSDGIKIKGAHDFAAKALDHRGLFKNAGA